MLLSDVSESEFEDTDSLVEVGEVSVVGGEVIYDEETGRRGAKVFYQES